MLGSVKRGGGLVRLPSKCFRISHPLLRSERIKGEFALCGGRRGAPPLDPATFEKVDETFTVEFICATFFILLLFLQTESASAAYATEARFLCVVILIVIYKLVKKLWYLFVHFLVSKLTGSNSLVSAAAVFEHKTAHVYV